MTRRSLSVNYAGVFLSLEFEIRGRFFPLNPWGWAVTWVVLKGFANRWPFMNRAESVGESSLDSPIRRNQCHQYRETCHVDSSGQGKISHGH